MHPRTYAQSQLDDIEEARQEEETLAAAARRAAHDRRKRNAINRRYPGLPSTSEDEHMLARAEAYWDDKETRGYR